MICKVCKTGGAAALAALFLSSCGLWDFVLPAETTDAPMNVSPDVFLPEDASMPGMLIQERHMETIGESFDVAENPATEGYIRTAFLPGATLSEAEAALAAAGVENYVVERKRNPAAAGVVYAVEYAGFTSDGAHYVNPVQPVCLYVSADKPVFPEATTENTVYITFDDGPTEEGTLEILDILDGYGIKATFFLVGDSVEKYPESAKAIYERGHDVACHSMTHQYETIYASAEALVLEADEWVRQMEALGVDFSRAPRLFRYPGGSSSRYFSKEQLSQMNELLTERGFRVYDWNIVTNDALLFQRPDGTTAYEYIKSTFLETYETEKNSSSPRILLLHETVEETRVVLSWMIDYLIEDGCAFAPLSSLEESWTFADENQ